MAQTRDTPLRLAPNSVRHVTGARIVVTFPRQAGRGETLDSEAAPAFTPTLPLPPREGGNPLEPF
jgi:hypothetical protein